MADSRSARPEPIEMPLTGAGLNRLVGPCREWLGTLYCQAPAEFVLWGKMLAPEALGPRCYDHAARHVGHRALSRGCEGWAILDLRPIREVFE